MNIQGSTVIQEGGRYKLVSDGDNNNMIMLAITKVKDNNNSNNYNICTNNNHSCGFFLLGF